MQKILPDRIVVFWKKSKGMRSLSQINLNSIKTLFTQTEETVTSLLKFRLLLANYYILLLLNI